MKKNRENYEALNDKGRVGVELTMFEDGNLTNRDKIRFGHLERCGSDLFVSYRESIDIKVDELDWLIFELTEIRALIRNKRG